MLKLDQISVQAGAFTLEPMDMEIASGECHALLGPSGAGKSTVLELIVGFRELKSGEIHLNGKNLAQTPVERRNIGYLPQHLALFPHLTVKENILYGIRCRRKPDKGDLARIASLTEAMGLTELENRKPTHLSGGERQRVALARALAPAPEMLILDEPFSALNEALRRELWILVKELQNGYGVDTLMVTHDLEEAFFFGEKVHILIDGCLQQSASRRRVFDQPATLEVARFLGIQNLFPAQVTHKNDEIAMLDCTSLGIQITIRNGAHKGLNLKSGDALTAGIRPEYLTIKHSSVTNFGESSRLTGRVVEITETMQGFLISIQPLGREGLLKMAIGFQEATPINSNDEIEVYLPMKHLFFIPQ
jgi:ABC-type Fe3+/spermidine/putrescine transport system ATPase subunit